MLVFETLIAIFVAYLLGSISAAIVTCKLMGLPDPRTQGSHNPGATNVLRIGGKKAAIFTLAGDVIKGVIPVLIAKLLGFDSLSLSLITLAVFIGHLYPVFFGFEGGKGVATAFGCLITLAWPVGLALLGTWLVVAIISRYSSLAAIVASVCCPFYMWLFTMNGYFTLSSILISGLLIYRHTGNIRNLLSGKESKIGTRKML